MESPLELTATRRAPQIVLSKRKASLLIVFFYTLAVLIAWSMFWYIERVQNYNDDRDATMLTIIGVTSAGLCVAALYRVLVPRPPGHVP